MKVFSTIAVVFLSLISLMQMIRFLLGWQVTVDGISIPVWASGIAFVFAGALAAMLWRESRR
jgi:hypothetical protein